MKPWSGANCTSPWRHCPTSSLRDGSPDDETRLRKAAKQWRAAKAREGEARDELAAVVQQVVADGLMRENKVCLVTDTPRMTIRKMLGKT